MSATLTDAIESLHIAAAQKLRELIQTETDPQLLARLIATAFRFKLPKPANDDAASNAAAPSSPDRVRQGPDSRADNTRNAPGVARAGAPANPTSPEDHDELLDDGLHVPLPPPYTDQQFYDLVKKYGFGEADAMRQRRHAITAQHTSDQRQTSAAG